MSSEPSRLALALAHVHACETEVRALLLKRRTACGAERLLIAHRLTDAFHARHLSMVDLRRCLSSSGDADHFVNWRKLESTDEEKSK